jgi:hypothetical protein
VFGLTIILRQESSHWDFLIPALAALGGAIVGGVVSGFYSLRGEETRQAFGRARDEARIAEQDRRDHAVVVGAARVLSGQYALVYSAISTAVRQGKWWPSGLFAAPALPVEDMKLNRSGKVAGSNP